jgi:hypothetical protein
MIENTASAAVKSGGLARAHWPGLLGALLGLSACVSDALPRPDDRDFPGRDAKADARDAGDATRADAHDGTVSDDVEVPSDGRDEGPADASADLSVSDTTGAVDVRGPDAVDVANDLDASADVFQDVTTGDADARADSSDATTVDAHDSGTSVDVTDGGGPNDAIDSGDASGGIDAIDAGMPADAADARDAAAENVGDGGVVVFFEEPFNSALGTFVVESLVCGANPPAWSNVAGYAHATEPIDFGMSRIASPHVDVPANVSNIRLRMSHRPNTEPGFDAATLLVSVNRATATQVTSFVTGQYTNGGSANPNTCAAGLFAGQYVGWSGNAVEFISEVNLSAAPFNVGAGDTVSIVFRMTIDELTGGAGWDINWVTLSGTSP